jgi:hypothetical protein
MSSKQTIEVSNLMKCKRALFITLLSLLTVCLVSAGLLALSNRNLPQHSQVVDHLSPLEKARLAEAVHLRQELGSAAWPGWGEADVPIIVANEEYAFLVNYPDPPDGWVMMPRGERRGSAWEEVPGDTFQGQAYYRQRLKSPSLTPENFTVLVGNRWAATMGTKEYIEVAFYDGFRQELPSFLKAVFPYRLFWGQLMGKTENYIGGLEHESFHAWQGSQVPDRLADAENINRMESQYPWNDETSQQNWQEEMDLLVSAIRAPSNEEASKLGELFLAKRECRRLAAGLIPDLVDYERQREWLEGLAKYAELELVRLASNSPDYVPLPELADDPDFAEYKDFEKFWSEQLNEAKRAVGREGENRFYYGGMAQAVLLDRLYPGWKDKAFQPGVMLEDLLREAVAQGE